jgi:replication fork protection complex subunit Tof1/Swi1
MSNNVDDDDIFESHLLSICTALGGFEATSSKSKDPHRRTYVPGDEAMDCLRDLKRFLRLDEEAGRKATAHLLGKFKVLEKDLIPLLQSCVKSKNMKLALSTCN